MNKLTLKQSEWLWAINRSKSKQYYAKNYGFKTTEFSPAIGGWIVKDILSSSDLLLKRAFDYFNLEFTTILFCNYPTIPITNRPELSRQEICWLMFYSVAYRLTVKELDKIIVKGWRKHWKKLDEEFFKEDGENND